MASSFFKIAVLHCGMSHRGTAGLRRRLSTFFTAFPQPVLEKLLSSRVALTTLIGGRRDCATTPHPFRATDLRAGGSLRSAARSLALRERGFCSISNAPAVTGFLVNTR